MRALGYFRSRPGRDQALLLEEFLGDVLGVLPLYVHPAVWLANDIHAEPFGEGIQLPSISGFSFST